MLILTPQCLLNFLFDRFLSQPSAVSHVVNNRVFPTGMTCDDTHDSSNAEWNWNYSLSTSSGQQCKFVKFWSKTLPIAFSAISTQRIVVDALVEVTWIFFVCFSAIHFCFTTPPVLRWAFWSCALIPFGWQVQTPVR